MAPPQEMPSQLRIPDRIAFTALSETAGLKLMKNVPCQFFDLRGRNVEPRKSNFSLVEVLAVLQRLEKAQGQDD